MYTRCEHRFFSGNAYLWCGLSVDFLSWQQNGKVVGKSGVERKVTERKVVEQWKQIRQLRCLN